MKQHGMSRLLLLVGVGVALTLVAVSLITYSQTRAAGPAFNNEGISADGASTSADFDGAGFSYSANALQAAGFASGAMVTVKGISFQWTTVSAGANDNWQADSQVIPMNVPEATTLAFLGSATHGPSSGTGILTYSDSSTQSFTLAFSDWTLNAGKSSVLAGDSIVTVLGYRNSSSGAKQTVKTYLFFTSVTLAPGKTLESVTLPNGANQGALHVFAIGTAAATPVPAFNNQGISADGVASGASFDTHGNSYSNDALQAAGFTPATAVVVNGISFQWPTVGVGTSDNWRAAGQVIPLLAPGATTLAFLGSANNGPSSGTVTLTYTDNSTQHVTLAFSDWTLNAGKSSVLPADSIAATLNYRNTSSGAPEATKTYLFFTSVKLAAGKALRSVTLPATVNQGALHVFAVGTLTPPSSSAFNNEGISVDATTNTANFDGAGSSYSNNALQAAGFGSGATVTVNGVSFQWPTVAAGTADNWRAAGQVISISAPGATTLGFLGAANNGPSSGTVKLTYTDNSTQSFTLSFGDWTLNAGKSGVLPGNSIAATLGYRNTSSGGRQVVKTYLFFTSVVLAPGKTLQSVTLPNLVSQGGLHVFAIGTATTALSSGFNNEGIKVDGTASSTSFDGVGYSYSANALQAAGFGSGATVTVNGMSFHWPTVAAGKDDNWLAAGQTIPINAPNAAFVGFLGAASRGPSSGTVTLTYSDNSTQTFLLSFSDWTLNGGTVSALPVDTVVATLSYRDTSSGAKQATKTYLFFTSVALQPGKTLQSVTLPNLVSQGGLHIFAIGTTAGPQGNATWDTYLGDPAHSGYNAAETTITPQTAASLKKLWTAQAGAISVQPVVGNNLIYWGSWDGYEHASNFAGTQVWQTFLGQTIDNACQPPVVGVATTPTLGMINGTPALFIGGGNNNYYALNALTGAVIWQLRLGSSPSHFLWSSPLVVNGSIYVGISSFGDCPLVQGQLLQLDAKTGAIQHVLNTVPNGCTGGSIWGTPTFDAASGDIFFTTGNNGACSSSEPLTYAVVAVRASDLAVVSSWQVPPSQLGVDSDFGSTPTLFTATINNTQRALVGVENKNGIYYAFDRTNLSAGPVWQDQIAVGGDCPQCGFGSISPSAWDGTTLYVAGGMTTIKGTKCAGGVRAVNPATGAFKWEACIQSGPVLGALTAIPGALVVNAGPSFFVLSSTTGATLFTFTDTASGALFYGPATVVNGVLYDGNIDGKLYAFAP